MFRMTIHIPIDIGNSNGQAGRKQSRDGVKTYPISWSQSFTFSCEMCGFTSAHRSVGRPGLWALPVTCWAILEKLLSERNTANCLQTDLDLSTGSALSICDLALVLSLLGLVNFKDQTQHLPSPLVFHALLSPDSPATDANPMFQSLCPWRR